MKKHWELFCRVIDNYGDIAVCWRLAKTLTQDNQIKVRIWVDDLSTLKALVPATDRRALKQQLEGIEVFYWSDPWSDVSIQPAEVVIETFGCSLPEAYLQRMQQHRPVWINLDYFSAEPWVCDFHRMPSKQANGLDKFFFYPSVLEQTGGLMREASLLEQRQSHLAQPESSAWLSHLGLKLSAKPSLKISLFGYSNPQLPALLDSWINAHQPIEVFLPQGQLHQQIEQCLQLNLEPGKSVHTNQLTLHSLPFLPQADFDKLLWHCDLNFVRGEESFVRAQWAAKPFVWHIYPTDDQAHWTKLDAFFDRYTQGLATDLKKVISLFNKAWNQAHHQQLDHQAWLDLIQQLDNWQQHSQDWVTYLNELGDLTSNLVKFVESKV
ncbi:elongation factor P maturation arginine rhamnosyltransferase EarP [Thiomicrospira sp. R3]|uniref:elongation factor P maturation arginine rhamnosyltransferase EarP n=1 Tax=Thiomicrospira sp. R3 TaxID=3035472 RepID=UPI00259B1AB4|nr:elongation factor P maturation arginine rhamnosyltransferase EarP [Thiomicrospira sp. R3]WFE68647.1 elongation factor P maturation arginine rhamnosyltransferase EarP [Thiomicrospira sp. R3]